MLQSISIALASVAVAACQFGDGKVGGGSVGSDIDASIDDPDDPDAAPLASGGRMTQPRHGDLIGGNTAITPIAVQGQHARPNVIVDGAVLAGPAGLGSWPAAARTVSGDALTDGGYPWSAVVVPGPARWPQGGVLRLRAVDEDGEVMTGRFHDSAEPYDSALGVVLVSPSDAPLDVPYLDRRGRSTPQETLEYYAAIDAPLTLDEFRTRYNTGVDPTSTRYYNAGDLAVGREARCTVFAEGAITGVACETGNYGAFGGDPELGLAEAITGEGRFATVAMVYRPPITAPNAVQFIVYDALGELLTEAELDTRGDNPSIPNNCLNCHGSSATYDPAANAVTGARFLPFDPAAFYFPSQGDYTLANQQESFRLLNALVLQTEPSIATRELVDGMYAVEGPADVDFVPAGWRETAETEHVYREVIAHACRTCHVSRDDALSFGSSAEFLQYGAMIQDSSCGPAHDMPNAEAVLLRLWAGRGRAYLTGFLASPGSCAPTAGP